MRWLQVITLGSLLTGCSYFSPAPAPRVTPERAANTQQAQPQAQPNHAAHEAHGGNAAQPVPSVDGKRRFGQPFATNATNTRLNEILQSPERFNNQALQVQGTVVAVCQHMGCWMEMRDENTQAHIRMHGHSFFLPRDVNGHRATIQGTLVAAHPATECDQTAQEATGRVAQVELDATGVEVFD